MNNVGVQLTLLKWYTKKNNCMEVETIAILISIGVIGLSVVYILLSSSQKNRQSWQPALPQEKDKISPIMLVEEAHTWYVSSKQESELLQALVKTSYGVACLRAIQNNMHLEEVKGAMIPPNLQGPAGLMAKLSSQESVLLNALAVKQPRFEQQSSNDRTNPRHESSRTQPSILRDHQFKEQDHQFKLEQDEDSLPNVESRTYRSDTSFRYS